MSTSNKGRGVDTRLQNLTNALYLTETDDVALRTGITGDIIIEGDVTIPGTVTVESSPENPVHVHVTESTPIDLSATTLAALENTTVTISGTPTVNIGAIPEVEVKNDTGNPLSISRNTSANSTTNRIYVSMETDAVVADSNYYLNVARGLVDSHASVERSAYMAATPNEETSIWVEGGIYPHSTWTTAQRLYVASDNVADTGQTIFIEGLDSNYDYVTASVTTNGTTAVSTTQTFIRIYTATITSANSSNAGEIRFRIGSAAGTVVAHIRASFGITKLSQYTVPAGHTAYVLYGDVATFKNGAGNQSGIVKMMVRPYNGSFIAAFIAQISNGYYRNDFTVPLAVTEKSDIDVRITTDATGATVTANYQLLVIPN